MKYSISLKNHLIFHKATLFYYLLGAGVLYYLDFDRPAVFIFGIWWAVDLIPALYLHLEYLLMNRGLSYEITTNEFIQGENDQERTIKVEEIDKVIVYKSASMDKGGIPFLAIESYYYARIILKSGDEFILTRLLIPKLEEVIKSLKGVKFLRKKRLFCTVFWR